MQFLVFTFNKLKLNDQSIVKINHSIVRQFDFFYIFLLVCPTNGDDKVSLQEKEILYNYI